VNEQHRCPFSGNAETNGFAADTHLLGVET